jgi:hypothetical protein
MQRGHRGHRDTRHQRPSNRPMAKRVQMTPYTRSARRIPPRDGKARLAPRLTVRATEQRTGRHHFAQLGQTSGPRLTQVNHAGLAFDPGTLPIGEDHPITFNVAGTDRPRLTGTASRRGQKPEHLGGSRARPSTHPLEVRIRWDRATTGDSSRNAEPGQRVRPDQPDLHPVIQTSLDRRHHDPASRGSVGLLRQPGQNVMRPEIHHGHPGKASQPPRCAPSHLRGGGRSFTPTHPSLYSGHVVVQDSPHGHAWGIHAPSRQDRSQSLPGGFLGQAEHDAGVHSRWRTSPDGQPFATVSASVPTVPPATTAPLEYKGNAATSSLHQCYDNLRAVLCAGSIFASGGTVKRVPGEVKGGSFATAEFLSRFPINGLCLHRRNLFRATASIG